jgi:methylenetetrahydrofolate reductase (NADPH)
MTFLDKLHAGMPTLSFEFFPPKDNDGWGTLYSSLGSISKKQPDYVTVTYGAGGSTRQKTIDLVSRIQNELGIEAMAHLTCVGHSRVELTEILTTLQAQGVRYIMALRGDPPGFLQGNRVFTPHPDGFAHASDLIAFIKANFDFSIGCSFYPDKHPEAGTLAEDIGYLKLKQDVGADFAVSQIFFDNDGFARFRDQAAQAGVTIPLVAGILPITSIRQLAENGICRSNGTCVPPALEAFIGSGTKAEIAERGFEFAHKQSRDLLERGVAGIHFYTLNRVTAVRVTDALRTDVYFPLKKLRNKENAFV